MKTFEVRGLFACCMAVLCFFMTAQAMAHSRANYYSDTVRYIQVGEARQHDMITASGVKYKHKGKGYQCIYAFNRKICGYNCIKTPYMAVCADHPQKRCWVNRWGDVGCGFRCVESRGRTYCNAPSPCAVPTCQTQVCVTRTCSSCTAWRCRHGC